MNDNKKNKLLTKLAKRGVVHRAEVQGYEDVLKSLARRGLVVKVPKRRRVYYELTDKALPLLENHRQRLLGDLKTRRSLEPRSRTYRALLEDVRFVDETKPEAQEFLLLGDFQLNRPLVPAQLTLARQRFYNQQFGN